MSLKLARWGKIALPSGRLLDVNRRRSAGTLNTEELVACRQAGLPLAYDPVQFGWVPDSVEDDVDPSIETTVAADAADLPMEFGGRYRLRRWRQADAPRFVALLDNPTIWEHLPETYPAPLTEELARDLIALSNESSHHEVFAVELDGDPVGQVRLAFDPGSDDRSEGEISYWIGEPYWGSGIGRALVAHFTALSFQRRPELRSIFARVHERNPASARSLEKAGYRSEVTAGNRTLLLYRCDRHQHDETASGGVSVLPWSLCYGGAEWWGLADLVRVGLLAA